MAVEDVLRFLGDENMMILVKRILRKFRRFLCLYYFNECQIVNDLERELFTNNFKHFFFLTLDGLFQRFFCNYFELLCTSLKHLSAVAVRQFLVKTDDNDSTNKAHLLEF